MFKSVAIVFLILAFAFGCFCYISRVSERHWGLIEGQMLFKSAELEVAEYGYVTNHGTESRVWLSSNVVSIGGTKYQCFLETTNHWFQDEGILAVTTNHELIWLDSKRPPKIIPTNYVPPIFPPHF